MGMDDLDHRLHLGMRDHQQGLLLPPPLGDTVEQAIFHNEMWCWVGCRLKLLPLGNPHLGPAVFKAIVLMRLPRESPGSGHLLEQVIIEV